MLIVVFYYHHIIILFLNYLSLIYNRYYFREVEGPPENVESSNDEDNCEDSDKSKIPKKRFPWTEEAK